MRVATWPEMADVLPNLDVQGAVESALAAYSRGEAVIPPVGEMHLDAGEVHLKYGYLRGGTHYVVKIASGFYGNPALGLPSSNGLMLLFAQQTGEPVAVLLDEGRLTDARTAAAGAVAAKHLAPQEVRCVGIVGTGIQARLQLEALAAVTSCREVMVWGRRPEAAHAYAAEMPGWRVRVAPDIDALVERANLIVTTTPADAPLIGRVRPGTHITAMGSDTPDKQELAAELVARADVVVGDSLSQCRLRGEISQAIRAGLFRMEDALELGDVIGGAPGRSSDAQITVADLTGVAVQDLAIAEAVYLALRPG